MRNDTLTERTGLAAANRMRLLGQLINHELLITFAL